MRQGRSRTLLRVRRGGSYLRALGPRSSWSGRPDDTSYSKSSGGRWNPKGEFGALYLSRGADVALANGIEIVNSMLAGVASVADLIADPRTMFEVQEFAVRTSAFVDAVTAKGCAALSLPAAPKKGVGYTKTRAIGKAAYAADENGIACVSAVKNHDEELAIFDSHSPTLATTRGARVTFAAWTAAHVSTARGTRKKKKTTRPAGKGTSTKSTRGPAARTKKKS